MKGEWYYFIVYCTFVKKELLGGDTMLVINAIFRCKEGKREEFLRMIRNEGIDVASRGEEGNSKYDFYLSAENDTDILLLEFWKDRDAHALHRTFPHYARLGELKPVYVEETIVNMYDVDTAV